MQPRTPIFRPLLLLCLVSLAACESDTPLHDSDGTPGPEPDGENLVQFEIRTRENDGSERLRWVGNGDGPFASSPEQTPEPWVGYDREFRVDILMKSLTTRVDGYQVRFGDCEEECVYWPVDELEEPRFDAPQQWVFDPQLRIEDAPFDCLQDPECAPDLILPSGEFVFRMRAMDNELNIIERSSARIAIQVNYAPEVELQRDGGGICDDETVFPHYVLEPWGGGAPTVCSIAEGDTIPVGAVVHTRLSGYDRLDGSPADGDLCCDRRLDPDTPEMRFQGRLEFWSERDRGSIDPHSTFFSPLSEIAEHEFRAGPFDYRYIGRGRDEHGRPSVVDPSFDFVAGFAPRILQIEPNEGDRIILRDPTQASPWPDNDFAYRVETDLTRYWDPVSHEFYETTFPGAVTANGAMFYIEPQWTGAADPRSPRAANDAFPPNFSGGVLAWAYEWIEESDPENTRGSGPGYDDLGLFSSPDGWNLWNTGLDGGFSIFVPELIWTLPQLFECGTPSDFCDMGNYLRERLGQITLLVRGRSTRTASSFIQCSPGETESSNCSDYNLDRRGRYSDVVQRQFSWRLGLDPDDTGSYELWPPESAPKRARLGEEELRLRLAQPRR